MIVGVANQYRLDRREAGGSQPFCQQLGRHGGRWEREGRWSSSSSRWPASAWRWYWPGRWG